MANHSLDRIASLEADVSELKSGISAILAALNAPKAEPSAPVAVKSAAFTGPKVLSNEQFANMLKWQTVKAQNLTKADGIERSLWYVFSTKSNRDYLLVKKASAVLSNGTKVRTIRSDGTVVDAIKLAA